LIFARDARDAAMVIAVTGCLFLAPVAIFRYKL
jgi:hypothetical protein